MSTFSEDRQDRLALSKLPAAENSLSLGTEVPATPRRCWATDDNEFREDWLALHQSNGLSVILEGRLRYHSIWSFTILTFLCTLLGVVELHSGSISPENKISAAVFLLQQTYQWNETINLCEQKLVSVYNYTLDTENWSKTGWINL